MEVWVLRQSVVFLSSMLLFITIESGGLVFFYSSTRQSLFVLLITQVGEGLFSLKKYPIPPSPELSNGLSLSLWDTLHK